MKIFILILGVISNISGIIFFSLGLDKSTQSLFKSSDKLRFDEIDHRLDRLLDLFFYYPTGLFLLIFGLGLIIISMNINKKKESL